MIGWYIHHVGVGHLTRAEAVSRELRMPVAGLSSLPPPAQWQGPWVGLDRDDDTAVEPTARGQLHWAPVHDDGLRSRTAEVSAWIDSTDFTNPNPNGPTSAPAASRPATVGSRTRASKTVTTTASVAMMASSSSSGR